MTEGIKRFNFDEPMEARSVATIPEGSQWQYEPKWDGFRCLLGRSGEEITMRSKAGRDLARYFPEIVAASKTLPERHFIIDGEIVILLEGGLSFEALLQRIHPAATRIRRLSGETPATFLAFDLLKWGRRTVAVLPLQDRRKQLENFADRSFGGDPRLRLSPASKEIEEARRWLAASGQGSDGIIAKRVDLPYQGGTRDGMQKIKRARTADCADSDEVARMYRYEVARGFRDDVAHFSALISPVDERFWLPDFSGIERAARSTGIAA